MAKSIRNPIKPGEPTCGRCQGHGGKWVKGGTVWVVCGKCKGRGTLR